MVEPHRLIVEERRVKRRRVVHLQIRARVGQQREARRVRFGKSVQRKRSDRQGDLIGGLAGNALPRHPLAQLHFDLLHPPFRSLEAQRAAQFFRLPSRKSRGDHGNPQQLFLKQRHAERALQNRFERGMRILHGLASSPTIQKRMHHLPDDGPRTNDRDLDDDVVEGGRLEARKRRHLRARFDLEDADRVGFAQHSIDERIFGRQMREIDQRLVTTKKRRTR